MWILLHTLTPLFTVLALNTSTNKISYRQAFLIHTSHLPAKYLPGGIWHSVARSHEYYNLGFSVKQISMYILHENVVLAATTLFIGAAIILTFNHYDYPHSITYLAILIGTLSLIVWPILTYRISKIEVIRSLHFYFYSILVIATYWIIAGFLFASYFNSLPTSSGHCSLLYSAGVYIYSWAIGFITIIAPQGLGVTEYVASNYLCKDINAKSIIIVIASYRIIILIADLITWSITRILKHETSKTY